MKVVARLALVMISALLVGCGYTGDGKFEAHGTWPFTAYELKFPEWTLVDAGSQTFKIRGWKSHNSTFMTMTLRSPDPVVFAEVPLQLAVTIAEPDGRFVFTGDPDVFAHIRRMQRISAADWPLPGEWRCDHDWGDEAVNRRAVPFLAGATPRPQHVLHCSALVAMPDRNYNFTVKNSSGNLAGHVSVEFEFNSSWK